MQTRYAVAGKPELSTGVPAGEVISVPCGRHHETTWLLSITNKLPGALRPAALIGYVLRQGPDETLGEYVPTRYLTMEVSLYDYPLTRRRGLETIVLPATRA